MVPIDASAETSSRDSASASSWRRHVYQSDGHQHDQMNHDGNMYIHSKKF